MAMIWPEITDHRVFDISYLTWDECSYSQLLLHWGLSDPRIVELSETPQFSALICTVKPQSLAPHMPRTSSSVHNSSHRWTAPLHCHSDEHYGRKVTQIHDTPEAKFRFLKIITQCIELTTRYIEFRTRYIKFIT